MKFLLGHLLSKIESNGLVVSRKICLFFELMAVPSSSVSIVNELRAGLPTFAPDSQGFPSSPPRPDRF
jgi:hypothetical protein